jgi:hypothetical protein
MIAAVFGYVILALYPEKPAFATDKRGLPDHDFQGNGVPDF